MVYDRAYTWSTCKRLLVELKRAKGKKYQGLEPIVAVVHVIVVTMVDMPVILVPVLSLLYA